MIWTDERCAELQMLGRLVQEVAAINASNGCLQRIAECIQLARKLGDSDTERPGFVRWLHELAIQDRMKA